jgi:hypothetical protein
MNRKKLTGFRHASLDDEMVGLLASKKQLVTCCNGHLNQRSAKVCWKCGEWLNLGV